MERELLALSYAEMINRSVLSLLWSFCFSWYKFCY